MEVINRRLAYLYERKSTCGQTKLVRWKQKAMIPNFPYLALSVSCFPTMLSPNFDYLLDFNHEAKCLRIVKTEDQKVLLEVPKDVITINSGDNDEESIREVYARVHFSRDNIFNVMNKKTQRRI